MQTQPQSRLHPTHLAKPAPAPEAPKPSAAPENAAAEVEWKPRKDLMNQMLAYRDWWNMPSRRLPRRVSRPAAHP